MVVQETSAEYASTWKIRAQRRSIGSSWTIRMPSTCSAGSIQKDVLNAPAQLYSPAEPGSPDCATSTKCPHAQAEPRAARQGEARREGAFVSSPVVGRHQLDGFAT